jgi:hypothetical protein
MKTKTRQRVSHNGILGILTDTYETMTPAQILRAAIAAGVVKPHTLNQTICRVLREMATKGEIELVNPGSKPLRYRATLTRPAPTAQLGLLPTADPELRRFADPGPKAHPPTKVKRTLVVLLQTALDAIDEALAYAKSIEAQHQEVAAGVAMLREALEGRKTDTNGR